MSSNLDRIATVNIALDTPISNDTSFDNILLIGNAPIDCKEGVEVSAVGVYNSLSGVTELGYVSTGEKPDPIGVAARVAFSQSPRPKRIYIAVQQLSENAKAAGKVISDTNNFISHIGKKDDLKGCLIEFNAKVRKLSFAITGELKDVKNTGVFDMLSELTESGYTADIGGVPITDTKSLMSTDVYKKISEKNDDAVEFAVKVSNDKGISVKYAVSVEYADTLSNDTADTPLDVPETELESPTVTLERALATSGWYCICPVGLKNSEVAEVIQWTETQNRICGYIETNPENPIVDTGLYLRSFAVYPGVSENQRVEDVPDENKYGAAVAMAVKAMNYHAGEETWALKQVSSITPSALSSTFINKLTSENITYIISVASKNVSMGGKTNGGEWIDVIRFRDWLQNDMQVRVVNLLLTNPKIPYTDAGIGLVENQMLASLKDGQKYGGIAPTEYDSDGNANQGYITSVPLASELTSTQKASRVLEDCKFSARLAGAIHLVEISGSLTYEGL